MKSELQACEVESIDIEKVNHAKSHIDTVEVTKVAAIFKALGDPNRARIVRALSIESELCVCDVANIIDATTATTSHHLRSLSKSGVTRSRKDGKMVYYSLDDDHIQQIVDMAFLHQAELKTNGK